jgi:hypothetical protein
MVGLMAEAGFEEKHKLDGLENAVKGAHADVHMLIVSLDYKYAPELELTGVG